MGLFATLTNYKDPNSLASRFRAARTLRLKALIDRIASKAGRCRILDLGGRTLFWQNVGLDFLAEQGCKVTVLNVAASEFDERACPTSIGVLTEAVGDACATGFADRSYDLVHSNSTIEHLGDWAHMRAFAEEVRRLAPAYFIQTPNFGFPVEPHFGTPFWHWLPEPVRVSLLMRRGYGHYPRAASVDEAITRVQGCHLIDRRLFSELFPDAYIVAERFCGLTKSLIAIRE